MVSLGNWEWLNDVDVTFSPEEDPETASYTLPGATFSNMKLRLHVFNLLDESYVSDADDGDGHAAASARVFLGLGRRWNISLSYDY